jgi:DNA (cytosine-5)-methyltransferase 1
MLVLSLFPGIDLLGRGFEAERFCVVRGPDLLWGGDVRAFHPPAGRFDGVIGGSPCLDFSAKRRTAPTGEGVAMLCEFVRVVDEAAPEWFLLENVPRVPDVAVAGYSIQRFDLNARECGMRQSRL